MVCTWNECVKRVAASQAQTSSLRADTLHWVKFFGWMRLAFREQLVVLMHRVPEGLPCPFTSGHFFFFSIAERAITALSVIASRRNCKRTCTFWQLIHSVSNSYHNVSTCSGEKQNQHNTKNKQQKQTQHNTNQNPKTTKTDPAKNTNQTFWPRAMPAKMVSVKPWTLYRHA